MSDPREGTAGEYMISDATLALLVAVANGLLPVSRLPRALHLDSWARPRT